ncbi:unnamed protein product [Lactuca virosa]|uniref:Transcription termination and cleavage factor C-terminal domain-containing protein n=1 Tax=Lactuca virosa TaxID=75947 RepID=A0AAU9NZP1_9ASTR|nr:unnamed protein product [Lactuca virosa]
MTRPELRELCKKHQISANIKTYEMVTRLSKLSNENLHLDYKGTASSNRGRTRKSIARSCSLDDTGISRRVTRSSTRRAGSEGIEKGTINVPSHLRNHIVSKIGNGEKTSVWHDLWHPSGFLISACIMLLVVAEWGRISCYGRTAKVMRLADNPWLSWGWFYPFCRKWSFQWLWISFALLEQVMNLTAGQLSSLPPDQQQQRLCSDTIDDHSEIRFFCINPKPKLSIGQNVPEKGVITMESDQSTQHVLRRAKCEYDEEETIPATQGIEIGGDEYIEKRAGVRCNETFHNLRMDLVEHIYGMQHINLNLDPEEDPEDEFSEDDFM